MGELHEMAQSRTNTTPTLEQFARLDEKTAGEIKSLGERMESWARAFELHVAEDRNLRKEFIDQQRQFDRMVDTLNAINKQLGEISIGFSRTVQETTSAMTILRTDVETLKSEREFRERESRRKETTMKRWVVALGAASSLVGAAADHFWK